MPESRIKNIVQGVNSQRYPIESQINNGENTPALNPAYKHVEALVSFSFGKSEMATINDERLGVNVGVCMPDIYKENGLKFPSCSDDSANLSAGTFGPLYPNVVRLYGYNCLSKPLPVISQAITAETCSYALET